MTQNEKWQAALRFRWDLWNQVCEAEVDLNAAGRFTFQRVKAEQRLARANAKYTAVSKALKILAPLFPAEGLHPVEARYAGISKIEDNERARSSFLLRSNAVAINKLSDGTSHVEEVSMTSYLETLQSRMGSPSANDGRVKCPNCGGTAMVGGGIAERAPCPYCTDGQMSEFKADDLAIQLARWHV